MVAHKQKTEVNQAMQGFGWLTVSLLIGPASWLMPHQGAISTLLPQRIADIDPANKVQLVMMFSTIAMLVALVSNIVLGACSDRTRTRFGKRKPWIVGCSVLSCAVLLLFAQAEAIGAMLAYWCLYEVVVNGVAAAMIAQLSDRVPAQWRGRVSSAYGIGQMAGSQLGVLVGAQFLDSVSAGVGVFALIALCGGVVSALMAGEPSNVDEPREPFVWRSLWNMFAFPTHHAVNFYKTLGARFLMTVGGGVVSNYMLYIIQDYLGLDADHTQSLLSLNSSLRLGIGLVCCVAIGPLADTFGHVKQLAVLSVLLTAASSFVPFVMPTAQGLTIFAVLFGIGGGMNASLIQSISVRVLPDPHAAAKDLGFLNLANTLGGVGASCLGAVIIDSLGYGASFVVEAMIVLCGAALLASVRLPRE